MDVGDINTANLPLISQTHEHHFDVMKNILLCHPNIDVTTLNSPQYEIKGITPLCLASYLGKTEIIQLLLEEGRVNVDGTDSKSATAFMYAGKIYMLLFIAFVSPPFQHHHSTLLFIYCNHNTPFPTLNKSLYSPPKYSKKERQLPICTYINHSSIFYIFFSWVIFWLHAFLISSRWQLAYCKNSP